MSARGARSRKAVVKDIEKKEKKAAQKGKAPDTIRRPHDAFADWNSSSAGTRSTTSSGGMPVRQLTISTSRRSSSTNDSGPRRPVPSQSSSDYRAKGASRPESVSDTSSTGKEKARYQTNGKDTKAPRGRGGECIWRWLCILSSFLTTTIGGVPIKSNGSSTPLPPLFRSESSFRRPTDPHHRNWMNFRIWDGREGTMRPYGGFDFVS